MKNRFLFALPLLPRLLCRSLRSKAAPHQISSLLPSRRRPPTANSPMANPDKQLEPLKPDTHEGFWGHLNPFARKKYVQRQLGPDS